MQLPLGLILQQFQLQIMSFIPPAIPPSFNLSYHHGLVPLHLLTQASTSIYQVQGTSPPIAAVPRDSRQIELSLSVPSVDIVLQAWSASSAAAPSQAASPHLGLLLSLRQVDVHACSGGSLSFSSASLSVASVTAVELQGREAGGAAEAQAALQYNSVGQWAGIPGMVPQVCVEGKEEQQGRRALRIEWHRTLQPSIDTCVQSLRSRHLLSQTVCFNCAQKEQCVWRPDAGWAAAAIPAWVAASAGRELRAWPLLLAGQGGNATPHGPAHASLPGLSVHCITGISSGGGLQGAHSWPPVPAYQPAPHPYSAAWPQPVHPMQDRVTAVSSQGPSVQVKCSLWY